MVLVALGILVSYAVRSQVLRVDTKVYVTERLQDSRTAPSSADQNDKSIINMNDGKRY